MIKQRWMEFEKKHYDEAPLNPYELTAEGLAETRKSIMISTLSLAALLLTILGFFRHGSFSKWGEAIGREIGGGEGSFLPVLFFLAFFGLLFGSLHFFSKSTDTLIETGLWMRLNVSDELQDEWELTEKRKSYTYAYNGVALAITCLFFFWLIVCAVHYAAIGTLPSPPRFGTVVVLSILAIWMLSLAPMAYTVWTLKPVDVDDVDGPILKPAPAIKPPLTTKQKMLKYGLTLAIVLIFFSLGYYVAINN